AAVDAIADRVATIADLVLRAAKAAAVAAAKATATSNFSESPWRTGALACPLRSSSREEIRRTDHGARLWRRAVAARRGDRRTIRDQDSLCAEIRRSRNSRHIQR